MPADYVILAVVAVLSIGGGLFLLHQARNYRRTHLITGTNLPKMTH